VEVVHDDLGFEADDRPRQFLIDDALNPFEACRRGQLVVDDRAGLL
jgi:hypothetical protein